MLNKIIEQIVADIPRSVMAVALILAVTLVAIQMYRGDALVCADGSIFGRTCDLPEPPAVDLTEIDDRLGGLEGRADVLERVQGLLTENMGRIVVTVEPTNFIIRGTDPTNQTTQTVPNSSENDVCFFTDIQIGSRRETTQLNMSLIPPTGEGRWTISLSSFNDSRDWIGGKVTCIGLPQ